MLVRKALRRLLRRTGSTDTQWTAPDVLQQFKTLMSTQESIPATSVASRVRVGIASFGAGPGHIIVDCLLAHALQLRGAECQLMVCDLPELPGCDERIVDDENVGRCAGCISTKTPFLEASGLDWVGLSSFLSDPAAALAMAHQAVAECADDELTRFEYEGWKLGEWLGTSVASFLRSDSHGMRREVIDARRRYLISGTVALLAARSWLDTWQPDILVVISGRHIFWRAAREIAASRGIKVVCREMFNEAFDCHIYSVNSSCEDPALPKAWADARRTPLTASQDRVVDDYLNGLPAFARQVTTDPMLETRPEAIRAELGVESTRRMVALFTNVAWDLFVAERDRAFDGQLQWIAATIEFMRGHPEMDLVIRAHPAEIVPRFRTRSRIIHQITEECSPLPANVRLIGPESTISSDALRAMASLNLVYCSSVGLEAIVAGQPVVVCGSPYYARKGFTIDVESPEHYQRLLDEHAAGSTPMPPPDSPVLARRFVHLIKFRYGMRMGLTTDAVSHTALTVHHFDQLQPGRSLPLDTACDGILHRDEILLPR